MAEVGLEALTLRRLATELGVVGADPLLACPRQARAARPHGRGAWSPGPAAATSPAPGQPWWEWLAERARLQFRALISHRDAALVVAGNRPTEAALPGIEEVLASLVAVALPARRGPARHPVDRQLRDRLRR